MKRKGISRQGSRTSLLEKHGRRRRMDREWINIAAHDTDDDNDNDSEVIEFLQLQPPGYNRYSAGRKTQFVEIQADAYEKLKRASDEREAEKRGELGRFSVFTHPPNVKSSLPLEWYTFRIGSTGVGFDLEMWWRKSANFLRLHVLLLLVLLVIFLSNVSMGVFFIVKHFTQTVKSPYLCETKECQSAAHFLSQPMNTSVDPCDNFYEFMCGKYEEPRTESDKFELLLSEPGFKLEQGEASLLAKILKDFRHDPTYDQSIRYYQSCLDEENKKDYGIKALLDRMEYIFGTRDFNAFNSGTEDMNQVAIRLFNVVGHAVYINVGFSTYPHVQIIAPTQAITVGLYYSQSTNHIYVRRVFNYLLPHFGLQADSPEVREMVGAVGHWADKLYFLISGFTKKGVTQSTTDAEFKAKLTAYLGDACPPMDIRLNLTLILDTFFQATEWHEEFFDFATRKYWEAIIWCFNQTGPFNYTLTGLTEQRSRLAFISIWVFVLFNDIMPIMHQDFILEYTNGLGKDIMDRAFIARGHYFTLRKLDIEYRCLNEMWTALGYLPSLRYLSANVESPIDFLHDNKEDIRKLYKATRKLFWRIPQEEIHPFMARQGELVFGMELQAEILMPLVGQTLGTYREYLRFTDDHLDNYFIALNLTIQSARELWLASTDRLRAPKWWAYGGQRSKLTMSELILGLRAPFIDPAHFREEKGAFTAGIWDKFLGRSDWNYILFPLSLYNEPHTTETWALKSSGSTLKIIRTILSVIGRIAEYGTYPYFMDWDPFKNPATYLERRAEMRENGGNGYNEYPINNSAQCSTVVILRRSVPPQKKEEAGKYNMESHVIQELSSNDYPEILNFFLNVMAVKFTFHHFSKMRKELHGLPYSSDLSIEERDYRMKRFLPGKMEKYNEDQLFFMGVTRQLCLQSWKKLKEADNSTERVRYELETNVINMLAHSEEFIRTFKCKGNSWMNNRGQPKCFKWVP